MMIRSRWLGSLLPLTLLAAIQAQANADAMFQVTSLGNGYSLNTDSDVRATTVTSGDGTQIYAFDKSPTVAIDQQVSFRYDPLHYINDTQRFYLQNGSIQAGDIQGSVTFLVPYLGDIRVPVVQGAPGGSQEIPFLGDWATYSNFQPIADLNAHGEVVGTGNFNKLLNLGSFAAFSTPGGGTHEPNDSLGAYFDDNLNNYIAKDLGINLTSALKVDDLGRIIAVGSTKNDGYGVFLLSPDGLSTDPLPTPEPATWVVLGLGAVAYAGRRRRAVA